MIEIKSKLIVFSPLFKLETQRSESDEQLGAILATKRAATPCKSTAIADAHETSSQTELNESTEHYLSVRHVDGHRQLFHSDELFASSTELLLALCHSLVDG